MQGFKDGFEANTGDTPIRLDPNELKSPQDVFEKIQSTPQDVQDSLIAMAGSLEQAAEGLFGFFQTGSPGARGGAVMGTA
jgi:hypothetical protein